MSIEITNLQFSYVSQPNNLVLDIPHWQLNAQQKCFLHAASGSGKTTLLNILSGLKLPTSGEVTILGERIDKMSTKQRDIFRANNIGYMFQAFNLIDYLSAIDNIKLASYLAGKSKMSRHETDAKILLSKLSVKESDWHRPITELSIGQQQRIGIARALINKPQLLLADEPTSSLDENAKNRFIELLSNVCQETQPTVIFVSHDTRLKTQFDHIEELSDINKVVRA